MKKEYIVLVIFFVIIGILYFSKRKKKEPYRNIMMEQTPISKDSLVYALCLNDKDFSNNNQRLCGEVNPNDYYIASGLNLASQIKLSKSGDYINLAEVKIFDQKNNAVTPLKVEVSSLQNDSYQNTNIIDDNELTFVHTKNADEWIMITLPKEVFLGKIVIVNRKDCCQEKAIGIKVETLLKNVVKTSQVLQYSQSEYELNYNTYGILLSLNNLNKINKDKLEEKVEEKVEDGISQMANCKNASNLNMFCALPDIFIEKCNNVSPQNYAASLEQCLINYSSLLKKENYERAVKLLNYPSNLPPTFPTVDCKLQEDQNAFCQKPDEFVDSCLLQTKVSPKDTYYANKMKECATTTNMALSKDIIEERRTRYNKAKEKLQKLYPTTKIVNFSSVDCTKEEVLFCSFPDEYVEGCYDATLPRTPTAEQVLSQNNMYVAKIENCLRTKSSQLLDKKKFSRAKELLLQKDATLKINDVPSVDCKLQSQLSYFCMTPDTYIAECKQINNTQKETYVSQLLQCLQKEKNRMTEDTYKNAVKLLDNPAELPKEFPTIDCKLESNDEIFCDFPEKFIKECGLVNNKTNIDYMSKLYYCLKYDRSKLTDTEYADAIKLFSKEELSNFKLLPSSLPTVDCFNPGKDDMICREPNKFVKECKDQSDYKDYPSYLYSCLTNKKQLMDKDKYNEAVKELEYPTIIPKSFPTLDCGDETNPLSFCRKPDEFISQCKELNRNKEKDYIDKLTLCLRNNTTIIQPDNYKKAITLLNNPVELPSSPPTVDCKYQDEQRSFCQKPNEFIESCQKVTNTTNKRYEEKLTLCLMEEQAFMNKDAYEKAITLLNNPSTLPSTLPSVDCKDNKFPDFCRKPNEYITDCSKVAHPTNEEYKGLLKQCVEQQSGIINEESYKKALTTLGNPVGLPKDLSANCNNQGSLNYFCSDPYKYVTNCEGYNDTLNYSSMLTQCTLNSNYLTLLQKNPDSYNKSIQYLKNSILPTSVPTVNCNDKHTLNMFCGKPDEYIRDCKAFYNPPPTKMLENCLNDKDGLSLLRSNEKGYIRAKNFLSSASLPSSLPTVDCNAKDNPSMFCQKPDEYIEFCNISQPHPEYYIRGCFNDLARRGNLTSLQNNPTGYLRALKLLNNPTSLPSEVPIQICDPRISKDDPYGYMVSCIFNESQESLAQFLNDLNSQYQWVTPSNETKQSYNKAYDYLKNKYPNIDIKPFPTDCDKISWLNNPNASSRGIDTCNYLNNIYDTCSYVNKEIIKSDLHKCVYNGKITDDIINLAQKINTKENKLVFDIDSMRLRKGCLETYINSNGYTDTRANLDYYFTHKDICKDFSYRVDLQCLTKDVDTLTKCVDNGFKKGAESMCGKVQDGDVWKFRNESFVQENPEICRKVGVEPCDDLNYINKNQDKCIGKITDHPCLYTRNNEYVYLKQNPEECRKLKLGEPCKFDDYLINHVEECRNLNYEPCKVDWYTINHGAECRKLNYEPCKVDGYTINHGEECRKLNYEPCKINQYLFNNEEECRKLNYEPCKINDYLFNNIDKCRKLNFEPCDKQEYRDLQLQHIKDQYYLLDGTPKYTIDKTCDLIDQCDKGIKVGEEWDKCESLNNKKYNRCDDKEYLETNVEKCKSISPNFNPCKDQLYMWQNAEECRKDGFEACKDNVYVASIYMKDSNECRKVGIEPCDNDSYIANNKEDCRKTNKRYEPCVNDNYLFNNEIECRQFGYEACDKEEYTKFSWNKDNCRKVGKLKKDPCDKEEYIKESINNALECKQVSSKYNPCINDIYKQNNVEECEPCTKKEYIQKNSNECRTRGYEACIDKDFILSNSKECRTVNNGFFEACYDTDFNNKNIEECRKVSPQFEPCERDDYLLKNGQECRRINSKYEACKNVNYLFTNGLECRQQGYEPCEVESYRINNIKECKMINDKYNICKLDQYKNYIDCQYNPCDDLSYLQTNKETCRLSGIEPCKNYSYLLNNVEECRNLSFDPCQYNDYLYNHIEECKTKFTPKEIDCEDTFRKNLFQDKCDKLNFKKYNNCNNFPDETYLTKNKDQCRTIGTEPCDNIFYKTNNQTECDSINFEKYNNCVGGLNSNYMLNNGQRCRELGQQGKLTFYGQPFEPCNFDSNYSSYYQDECSQYNEQTSLNEQPLNERPFDEQPFDQRIRFNSKFNNYNFLTQRLNINI